MNEEMSLGLSIKILSQPSKGQIPKKPPVFTYCVYIHKSTYIDYKEQIYFAY